MRLQRFGEIYERFGSASIRTNRAREVELRIGFGERFTGVRFDEGLLVGDELVQDSIGDLGLGCLDAIAYPRGRGDRILEDTR